uniref:Transposase n=1 Tax=Streptomyces sp. NBC_01393 TaxID=2903851 RepID=A0AAU3I6H8_9ACTN
MTDTAVQNEQAEQVVQVLIEPVPAAWRAERWRHALNIGRPPGRDLREIMDAIFYVDRTGCSGATSRTTSRPGKGATGYFAKRQKGEVFTQLTDTLGLLLAVSVTRAPDDAEGQTRASGLRQGCIRRGTRAFRPVWTSSSTPNSKGPHLFKNPRPRPASPVRNLPAAGAFGSQGLPRCDRAADLGAVVGITSPQ